MNGRNLLVALGIGLGLSVHGAFAQVQIEPPFSIWDAELGQTVDHLPDTLVAEIACGTNGGPPGQIIRSFTDYMACQPEDTGLREVSFIYDDEQDYIALALDSEYKFLHGGTSVYAHPVIVSVLVDPEGVVQGRRIFTDDRVGIQVRRTAYTLIRNFQARYGHWSLECTDIPMQEGEQPVGNMFIHERCEAQAPDGSSRIAIEATYLRKKGQVGVNRETQQVNKGYFESQTRFEEVLPPYTPMAAR